MTAMWVLVIMWLAILAQEEGDFAAPRAEGDEVTAATMDVDVEVTLHGSEGPAVVHLVLPGEAERTRPLTRREEDRWGVRLELRRADWRVVFEDLSSGVVSEEAALTELGLDPALLGLLPEGGGTSPADASRPALAAAVATFVGLATGGVVLVLFGRRSGRHSP